MRARSNASKYLSGKIPGEVLQKLFAKYIVSSPEVLAGPAVGLDAAAIQISDGVLLAKTDPITFASDEIGWYAIQVNANDIACMGGEPRWFLATLLLPHDKTETALVDSIFHDLAKACKDVGVTLVGGHTEVTSAVERVVIVGTMLGVLHSREQLLDPRQCQPDDRIVLTSGIAIEATAIIAQKFSDELSRLYDRDFVERCKKFSHTPGISVLPAAKIALQNGAIRALHDPTEGGLATALHELADASHCGCEIFAEAIPIHPESKLLCDQFGLDPFGVIASGALLIVIPQEHETTLLQAFHQSKIVAVDIGFLHVESERRVLHTEAGSVPLRRFDRDEIVKIF